MVKALLKSVFIVLVLAGIFLFAWQAWEKKKAKEVEKTAPPTVAAPASTVNRIDVAAEGETASIQIADVSSNYKMIPSPDQKGTIVEIPGAQVNLVKTSMANPHPLISIIDAAQVFQEGSSSAKIRLDFTKEATVQDRLVGKVLTLVVAPKVEVAPTPTPEPTATPVPEPKKKVTKKTVSSKRHVVPAKKTPKVTRPKPVAKMDEPEPKLEDLIPPKEEALIPPPEVAPKAPEAAAPTQPEKNSGEVLDQIFDDFKKQDVPAVVPPSEEAPPSADIPPPEVAAIPPAETGTFDQSNIKRDLSKIVNLSVSAENGLSSVVIDRESGNTKYHILKAVNPNRVIVEFLDATNGLQSEYGATPGSKVLKITTQEFPGRDAVITRVTIFVEGQPKYTKESRGKSVIIQIP